MGASFSWLDNKIVNTYICTSKKHCNERICPQLNYLIKKTAVGGSRENGYQVLNNAPSTRSPKSLTRKMPHWCISFSLAMTCKCVHRIFLFQFQWLHPSVIDVFTSLVHMVITLRKSNIKDYYIKKNKFITQIQCHQVVVLYQDLLTLQYSHYYYYSWLIRIHFLHKETCRQIQHCRTLLSLTESNQHGIIPTAFSKGAALWSLCCSDINNIDPNPPPSILWSNTGHKCLVTFWESVRSCVCECVRRIERAAEPANVNV